MEELYSVATTGGAIVKLSGTLIAGTSVDSAVRQSADGSRAVFVAQRDTLGERDLYSVPSTGGAAVRLSGAPTTAWPVSFLNQLVSPDSSRVVYVADKDADGVFEIYSVPITGGTPTKLSGAMVVGGSVFSNIQISADSSRVVFRADKDVDATTELYSVPIAGGAVTKLSGPVVSGAFVSQFVLSADSSRVVFVATKDSGAAAELFSVRIAGGSVTKLSGQMPVGGNVEPSVSLSADSERAVFLADKDIDAVTELYSALLDGGGAALDIDGDGLLTPGIDGLLLMRWQLGVRGSALLGGITFPVASTRRNVATLEAHLRRLSEAAQSW
jgi:Tol biopolymer transport system component